MSRKSFQPHHRSSEVFSGLAGILPHHHRGRHDQKQSKNESGMIKETDIENTDNVEIMMVRPMTIEEAIKKMQKVPSVEFACSKLVKSNRCLQKNLTECETIDENSNENCPIKQQTETRSNVYQQELYEKKRQFQRQRHFHNDSFRHSYQHSCRYQRENPYYQQQAATQSLSSVILEQNPKRVNDSSTLKSDNPALYLNQNVPNTANCETKVLRNNPLVPTFSPIPLSNSQQEQNLIFIDDSKQESYCEEPKRPVQKIIFPVQNPEPASLAKNLENSNSNNLTNNLSDPTTIAIKPPPDVLKIRLNDNEWVEMSTGRRESRGVNSYREFDKHSLIDTDSRFRRNDELKRSVSFRSMRSMTSSTRNQQKIDPEYSNDQQNAQNQLIRRQTMIRLGSDIDHSLYYFTPKESWLTSLYVKLPKSKSFSRIQLEMLNLPCFGSVGRFLEETATSADHRSWFESKSFLLNMFNQFVPHNRIPLNTLSKYVQKLKKYKILSTIEFNVS